MKRFITLLFAASSITIAHTASAQGWVGGKSGQALYAVNDSLKFGSLFVGIGTNQPTAQFHTTGTVRLTGITQGNTFSRLLVQDTAGNLYWRDAASIAGGSGWSLTGNAGTNRNTNFLGTTDNVPLVFRTNNTEKVTILANGNVGIGLAQPGKLLQVHNSSNSEDNNIMLSGSAPSMYFNQSATQPTAPYTTPYARLGLSTRIGTFANTSQPGDFVIHSIGQGANILFAFGVDQAGTNGVEKARFNSQGNLGINTTNPTAKLHVNGNVRFQNLPANTGKTLVVDDSGYVYIARTATSAAAVSNEADITALQQEIATLKQAIADLQSQMAAIQSGTINVVENQAKAGSSIAASPNPFNGTATIRYTYPATASSAYMIISEINGTQLKRYDLKGNTNGSVTITLDSNAQAGTYISNLEVDGKIVGSKKLIYNK